MKKNLQKIDHNKDNFFLCICSYCEQYRMHLINSSDILLEHMRNRQNIKTICVYCDESLDTLNAYFHHVNRHWLLGEKVSFIIKKSDRKNQTF